MDISKEIIGEIIAYIERTEKKIDGEWGDCRELPELIKDGMMPTLYWEIKELLK